MSFGIYEGHPGPGYWERDNSHFPLPMSRHLWELFLPAYDEGTRRGLARYGSIIHHFDFARVAGRLYLKKCFVDEDNLEVRARASEQALEQKLWRLDSSDWRAVREQLRSRLVDVSRHDPREMSLSGFGKYFFLLRELFVEGTLRHFIQQPSSMFPVGDWLLDTCKWTGASPAEVLWTLKGSHSGAADFLNAIGRLDEYADRIITGFDLVDLTLRELPQLHPGILPSSEHFATHKAQNDLADLKRKLRERVPAEYRQAFDDGVAEASMSYGLHDEDVRITYLWPLGLIRRAMLAAADRLMERGALQDPEHVFQTTPGEFDALLRGGLAPSAGDLAERAIQFASWRHGNHPPSFGEKESVSLDRLPAPCRRVNAAITFYLGEMENHTPAEAQPTWALMVAGLAASPGRYEGWARVVRDPEDFRKLNKGDVLVAHTTSPAYNVILPMIGAVVTDRGGTLCHCAIVAREFGIPAVVGADQATIRVPDGARILVDGDRGFVAVRS
jgi:rifampicin phosphotransferase